MLVVDVQCPFGVKRSEEGESEGRVLLPKSAWLPFSQSRTWWSTILAIPSLASRFVGFWSIFHPVVAFWLMFLEHLATSESDPVF